MVLTRQDRILSTCCMKLRFLRNIPLEKCTVLQRQSHSGNNSEVFMGDILAFLFCLLLMTMAAIDRKEANVKKLKEANAIQDRTEAAISRIQRQTAEAEELGTQTLDELRRQGKQMVCLC